jgi:hypothetical protein
MKQCSHVTFAFVLHAVLLPNTASPLPVAVAVGYRKYDRLCEARHQKTFGNLASNTAMWSLVIDGRGTGGHVEFERMMTMIFLWDLRALIMHEDIDLVPLV